MIETRVLAYFLAVARTRSFTGAAGELHITQPTLSRQMALLEESLGVRLFYRDSRPLTLTDEGLLLQRRAEEILELVAKTETEVSACEEQVEGVISIGSGELASVRLLTEWIASFQQWFPHVTFDLYTAGADQIRQRMEDGLTDIGLLLEPVDVEQYEYIRMPVRETWAAIMPAGVPLAKREHVTAQELADIPVILPSRTKVRSEVANWFGDYYETLRVPAVSNLSTNAAMLVRAGLGYGLTLEGALPFLEQSEVCMVPLYPTLSSSSVLAWKRGRPVSAALRRFIESIKCFSGMEDA